MAAGGSINVQLPASVQGASAVALNVTATDTTGSGFFTVYPTGAVLPTVSSLDYTPGANVANFVIVPVGSSNQITIYNGPPKGTGGSADAVVDLQGYFAAAAGTSGGAGHFNSVTPTRITDTRAGSGQANSGDTIGAGGSLTVQAGGVGGVPAAGVSAVEVNLTEAANTAGGFLTAYPQGSSVPTVSNLNFVGGQIVANRVVVPVNPANGQFSIFNHAGSTDVVLDVDGYFTDSTGAAGAGSLYNSVTPSRVIDTRSSSPIGPGGNLNVVLAGHNGLPAQNSADPVSAAVLNVTEADNTAGGFLTVSPSTPAPTASDVNFVPGAIVANGDIASTGPDGSINVFNHAGNTDVVLDVSGYFTPATPLTVYQSYKVAPALSSSPQQSTVSTGSPSNNAGLESYSVTGLPTTAGTTAYVTLFPCTGATAPVVSPTGAVTFPPSLGGAASSQAAGQAHSDSGRAFITSVNGVPTGMTAPGTASATLLGNGTLSFVLNDTSGPDCAVPVVFTSPSSASSPSQFLVDASGSPLQGYAFGVGSATQWNSAPAGSGTYTNWVVLATNPAAHSFQAENPAGNVFFTFTDNAPGSTYTYTDPAIGLTTDQFEADLSPIIPAPTTTGGGSTGLPAALGDELTISYNASGPSNFSFSTAKAGGAALGQADVPGAPTGLSVVVSSSPSGTQLSWTAPPNPDVVSDATSFYTVYRASVTNGTVGTYSALASSSLSACAAASSTCEVDTSAVAGTTYSYAVSATSGATGNTPAEGPASVPVQFSPLTTPPGATAPVSIATGEAVPATDLTNVLVSGEGLSVTFDTTVSLAGTFGLTVTDGTNTAVINNSNATASVSNTGSGTANTVTYTLTANPIISSGTNPNNVGLEALSQSGVSTGAGAWNLAGSFAAHSVVANATRVFGGSNANVADPAAPKVNSATPATSTVNVTCTADSGAVGVITVYDSNANRLGSAPCTANASTVNVVTTTAFSEGAALLVTQTGSTSKVYEGEAANFIAAMITPSAPLGGEVAGQSANWVLSANGLNGTFTLSVSGPAASPNASAPPTTPPTVTFTNGAAQVPVTLVEAASQSLVFTVDGQASTATAFAPTAAAGAYAKIINSRTGGGTYLGGGSSGSDPATYNAGPWTGPQSFTDATAQATATAFSVAVVLVDVYGNPGATGGPGAVTVTLTDGTASNSSTNPASPASLALTSGYATFVYTTGTTAGTTPDSLTVGGSGLSSFTLKVSD